MELAYLVQRLAEQATPEPRTGRLRLPTEREQVASLAVSRGALREQLSTLEMLGFVDRTQGRGSYLQVPDAGFMQLYFDLSHQLGHLTQPQFAAARELLEVAVAEAAARLASADDVDALRAIVDDMVRAGGQGDVQGALDADVAFHRRLVRVVDNPVFNLLHDGLSHVLHRELVARRAAAGESREIDTVHHGIVDAVGERDGDGARIAMRRHFEVFAAVTGA